MEMRVLASLIARATGASFGYLTDGANTTGACLAGILPGGSGENKGLHTQQMLSGDLKAFMLLGIEAELDIANPAQAVNTLKKAEFVVSLTPYVSDAMKEYASVLLPVSPYSETSGTFFNIEGHKQSFAGVAQPAGDARPAWKVLRVIGNLLDLDGFAYNSTEQILEEELTRIGDIEMNNFIASNDEVRMPEAVQGLQRIGAVLTYHEDNVVRRAASLQKTPDANEAAVRIHPALATRLGLIDAKKILVSQNGDGISMSFDLDESMPEDCVWLAAAIPESAELGALFAPIQVEAD
jgi:NADH-quinone oxidoreductase subunit G